MASRGCGTCRKRRVKCDGAQPICNRCQKAKVKCDGVQNSFLFLNENEYAVGRRKRPRGPNVKGSSIVEKQVEQQVEQPNLGKDLVIFETSSTTPVDSVVMDLDNYSILPALNVPLEDQAIAYFSRHHETPHGMPEMVQGHMRFAFAGWILSSNVSILERAVSAVAHAIFGRARQNQAALSAGMAFYAEALARTNTALRSPQDATNDDVVLSAMLLSFYENCMMDRKQALLEDNIRRLASRSFAHHDGAISLLKLRRQHSDRTSVSLQIDKLVRRQLLRTLLLRSMPVPMLLRDGAQFGEEGIALEFDRCLVIAAKLRSQNLALNLDSTKPALSDSCEKMDSIRVLLSEAQALEDTLAMWALDLPMENWYSTYATEHDGQAETKDRIFGDMAHIYPTVGHAGMWNRYRVIRLITNDIMIKVLSALSRSQGFDQHDLVKTINSRISRLYEELCLSVPYMLGLIGSRPVATDMPLMAKAPTSFKEAVTVTNASLLCWPLAMLVTATYVPKRFDKYLTDRLLDCSIIIDDGVLERIAVSTRQPRPALSAT
ncbi:hypothetical protein EJ05DRAFT_498328 [Pseudovirgaria hyperparasitica]|uniref:Zn(2)-C6 fungal-type domain-containing protein n=1 Tax=Pseudovirgaria hyperparasitica TaxID=470096 RepID=A0A6A6WGU4_9PEZI|nr:uncharacterized protein EJ05DRAFT_498328 [Pseudovirgaria hyperparasitica]KAF2760371.1 hypothetical protein EJ05DRAFT_498328 [Pseudovirgaria hyperparasitica]